MLSLSKHSDSFFSNLLEPPNISITAPTIALDTFSMVSYRRDEQGASQQLI
jgi:hypothetical protein